MNNDKKINERVYLDTDYCSITKNGDVFVYKSKNNKRNIINNKGESDGVTDNILGDVVGNLVSMYTNTTMSFNTFQYLEDYINKIDDNHYENSLLFIDSIIRQYKLLSKYEKTIFSLNVKNVIVIDKRYFIYIGCGGIDDIGAGIIDIFNKNKILDGRLNAIKNAGGTIDHLFLAPEFVPPKKKIKRGGDRNEFYISSDDKFSNVMSDDDDSDDDMDDNEMDDDDMDDDDMDDDDMDDVSDDDIDDSDEADDNDATDDSVGTNYNTCNYSIGITLMYLFIGIESLKKLSFEKRIKKLFKIHNTKVFFLIRRCIDKTPKLRALLYV